MNTWRFVISYTPRGWTTLESSEIHPSEIKGTNARLEAERMHTLEDETTVKSVNPLLSSKEIEEERLNAPRPCGFILFGLGLSQPNELPSQSETLLLER